MDIVLRFIIFIIFFIVSIQANDQINGLSVYLNIECQPTLCNVLICYYKSYIIHKIPVRYNICLYYYNIYIYITTIYIVSYICEQNSL